MKKTKLLSLLALLTFFSLLMAGFGKIDQVVSNTAELSAAGASYPRREDRTEKPPYGQTIPEVFVK